MDESGFHSRTPVPASRAGRTRVVSVCGSKNGTYVFSLVSCSCYFLRLFRFFSGSYKICCGDGSWPCVCEVK